MAKRKKRDDSPERKEAVLRADRAFFELKVYLLDFRPFIAGADADERLELRRRCRAVSDALDVVLAKPADPAPGGRDR